MNPMDEQVIYTVNITVQLCKFIHQPASSQNDRAIMTKAVGLAF